MSRAENIFQAEGNIDRCVNCAANLSLILIIVSTQPNV